jgi:hypothetical protein
MPVLTLGFSTSRSSFSADALNELVLKDDETQAAKSINASTPNCEYTCVFKGWVRFMVITMQRLFRVHGVSHVCQNMNAILYFVKLML